jgi:HK97 family phage prohead protease
MARIKVPTEFKAVGDSGQFQGYAAIFGNVDLGGDILERGSLKEINKLKNGRVVILSQHNQRDPIGTADVEEDDKGYKFDGHLILEAPSARRDYALMKGGALDGMSFGYDVLAGGAEVLKSGVRQLKAIKLWEISPVTFGMNPLAGVDAVKAAGGTIREFETFLRDVAGFTQREAKAVASGGWNALVAARDVPEQKQAESLLSVLQSFKL